MPAFSHIPMELTETSAMDRFRVPRKVPPIKIYVSEFEANALVVEIGDDLKEDFQIPCRYESSGAFGQQ